MYYVLDSTDERRRWIGKIPFIDVSWWRGSIITETLPDPIEFTLKPYNSGAADQAQFLPAYLLSNPLVLRDDFIQALKDFGVSNFDCYNVSIEDPDDQKIYTNYKAVNLIGLVAAADMGKSDAVVHDNIPLIDVDFDKLVVDESKTHGILMFRLAESTNTVLIHEKLKDYLIDKGFQKDMEFYEPDKVAL
jgi:hypothetical protein